MHSQVKIIEVHDNYVDVDTNDPVGHGTTVANLITVTAHEVSLSTFQAIGTIEEDGETIPSGNRGDTIQAIVDAGEAGVDILNLSIGIPHECGGVCSLSREAELVAEVDNVCIVAATGNHDESIGRVGVHCPALNDSVVGVGGYISICTAQIVQDDSSRQWWVENDGIIGPFCGQRGCSPNENCEGNREENPWQGNVSFHNCAPDVLAPVIEVYGNSTKNVHVQSGTSFATPLVSGLVAGILGDLQEKGIKPPAKEVRKAVGLGSTPLDQGGYNKFDMEGTWDWILQNYS